MKLFFKLVQPLAGLNYVRMDVERQGTFSITVSNTLNCRITDARVGLHSCNKTKIKEFCMTCSCRTVVAYLALLEVIQIAKKLAANDSVAL